MQGKYMYLSKLVHPKLLYWFDLDKCETYYHFLGRCNAISARVPV